MPIFIAIAALAIIALAAGNSAARGRGGSGGSLPVCRTDYTAKLLDGRKRQKPTLIVLHSTEGPSAESAAAWFTNDAAGGSAHVVVGEDGCFRTLPDDANAAGARDVNPWSLHIEFAGYAAWSRNEWLRHQKTLEQGRAIVHYWSQLYGIPLRKLTQAELRAGKSGVTTHADVSAVFSGDHQDPGKGFPLDVVLG